MKNCRTRNLMLSLTMVFAVGLAMPKLISAHCDTMGGPVVEAAREALKTGDINRVLPWVKKDSEKLIKEAFNKTVKVRKLGPEARGMADLYFFETLVRIHRAGEGEPYTGLKPAGDVEPAILEADKALESGSAADLVKLVTDAASKGIAERFNEAKEAKKNAGQSIDAGREFVEAYVQFTHYVERLHLDSTASAAHHGHMEQSQMEHHGSMMEQHHQGEQESRAESEKDHKH